MDCSLPCSAHGISQARILQWVAVSFFRDLPNPGIEPRSPAVLVENPQTMQKTRFDSSVGKMLWRRDRLPTPVFLAFPGGSASKESTWMQETWVQSPGWEDPLPWRREWLSTPVFWPGEFHGLYSPWGRKERQLSGFHSLTPTVQEMSFTASGFFTDWATYLKWVHCKTYPFLFPS